LTSRQGHDPKHRTLDIKYFYLYIDESYYIYLQTANHYLIGHKDMDNSQIDYKQMESWYKFEIVMALTFGYQQQWILVPD